MERVKRKLMAILAADAVGYSRMMGEDEVRTVRVLSDHREVIDALIANYGARIIGTAGDSVLAEFGSTVDAVRCATEIQEAIRERNEKLPEHERMWFRIGVNLGDVIVSEADMHGDGINVAVRLESIAEPGGVCISSSVYDQITGKLNLGFTDIGEQNLKNISRPIRAYRFAGPVPPIVPKLAKRAPRRRSAARWFWGAVAALTIVALAAVWQADLLTQRSAAEDAATAEAARRAEDEGRRRAGERAKMETELARARAEAEAARKQAVAVAEAQRALEAQRASEAELARARTEADAIRRDARAQALAASRAREEAEQSAAKAKALEEATARAAAEAQTQQQAVAKPVTASASYDGDWVAVQACPATRRAPEARARLPTTISQGVVQVRRGKPGENGYVSLDGKIAADGSLAIRGVLIPARAQYGRDERPVHYEGRLEGDQFLLRGEIGQRPCTLALNRFGR